MPAGQTTARPTEILLTIGPEQFAGFKQRIESALERKEKDGYGADNRPDFEKR